MDTNRLSNIMAELEKVLKDLVALIESMKSFFARYFETEDATAADESTTA